MDIIRLEAMSNYSIFYFPNGGKIIVSKTLKSYELMLTEACFFRVNRSVIVNLEYVAKYKRGEGGTLEFFDGTEVEVVPSRKEQLLAKLFA